MRFGWGLRRAGQDPPGAPPSRVLVALAQQGALIDTLKKKVSIPLASASVRYAGRKDDDAHLSPYCDHLPATRPDRSAACLASRK